MMMLFSASVLRMVELSYAGVGAYVGVGVYLAAVSENCVSNLLREGITGEEVRLVGDTMYESIARAI